MPINKRFSWKNIFIGMAVVAIIVVIFLVQALAGLTSKPVEFAEPPGFVAQHRAMMEKTAPSRTSEESDRAKIPSEEPSTDIMTGEYSEEEILVRKVLLEGESPDLLVRLFTHPEKAQRVKTALGFASVNMELADDYESGFREKRGRFWADVERHIPDIRNALYEALIVSAEEGTKNNIPYTIAWMPGQGHETVELLAWVAVHHPDPGVRQSCVFYVVELERHGELAGPLLRNRTHDPSLRVRIEVLSQRFRRLFPDIKI